MNVNNVIIEGFRSFGEKTKIPIRNKLACFVGYNSSGKTTALEALRKVFGTSNAEREIVREDFHIAPDEDPTTITEKHLSIEVQFLFSEDDKDSIAQFFSEMVVDARGKTPYMRVRLEASWTESDMHQDGQIEYKLYFISVPEGATESEDSRKAFPNHLRQLIQVLYVPAIRKPSDQIKYASGSMLYRVLRKIKWDKTFKENFEAKIEEVSSLFSDLPEFQTIHQAVNKFWSQFHKDDRYKEAHLNFGQSDFESVLKRMEASFSPSGVHRPFKVDELGEGYRSLFYLTLVCALLEVEEELAKDSDEIGITRPLITLLAVEEPENHIAPQLLGRVASVLSEIADAPNAQVFLSSHTPSIVKRILPESICHFRINDQFQTEVNIILLPEESDEAYKYVKEAVHHFPEIYFARLVIIGEGESEEVILNKMTEAMDLDFDDHFITFAPLGHRFVNHIWKLLNNLKIPYVTLLDLDTERHGGGWGRVKYILNQLILLGVQREKLLELSDGTILSDERLKGMHKWDVNTKSIQSWVEVFQRYRVYFSSPLDVDFLMLEHYSSFYNDDFPEDEGPNIPDKSKEPEKYKEKLESSIQATLKSEKATGATYSRDQKELMIWYQYHFLGRGKPSTHILSLSKMNKADIKGNLPPVFNELFKKIKSLIKK